MDVLDFAEKHPKLVTLIITTIGTLIWHHGRKTSLNDIWDTMLQLGRQALPDLLRDARLYDDAYVLDKIQKAIRAGLGRLGVKRTPIIEQYVTEVAEHVKAELAQRLFNAHITDFVKVQTTTGDLLKAAPPDKPIDTITPAVTQ